MKIAVYPGSFDPVTLGHLNLIERASKLFDRLIVAVGNNLSKKYLFDQNQRINLIKENIGLMPNVLVLPDKGLTVDFMHRVKSHIIVRGLRNTQDLSYERSVADVNHHLDSSIDTVFLLARPKYQAVSSSILKETFHFGGDISTFVPRNVLNAMNRAKNNHEKKSK